MSALSLLLWLPIAALLGVLAAGIGTHVRLARANRGAGGPLPATERVHARPELARHGRVASPLDDPLIPFPRFCPFGSVALEASVLSGVQCAPPSVETVTYA